MALTLSFSVVERNDNKLLTITDTSGEVATGTATGWGIGNALYTTIVGSGGAHTLELDIVVTTSDGTVTTYDTIDLKTTFRPGSAFSAVSQLTFPLTCAMLKVTGTAIGTADTSFPDGIYSITYVYDDGLGTEISTTTSNLVYGKVKKGVYELLRQMNTSYEYEGYIDDTAILTIFVKAYLDAILANDINARPTSITAQLYTLEKLLINEASYEI
jgi:hypothetical protein